MPSFNNPVQIIYNLMWALSGHSENHNTSLMRDKMLSLLIILNSHLRLTLGLNGADSFPHSFKLVDQMTFKNFA